MAPCQTVWSLKMALMVIICSLVAVYIAAGVEGMKPFVWGAFLLDSEKPTRNLEPLEYNIELEIAKERNAFKGTVDIFVKFLSTRNLFGRMAVGLAEILPSDESSGPTPERRVAFRLAEGLEVTEFKIKTAASIKELHEGHGELLHDGSTIKQCAIRSDAYAIDLNRNMPVGHYGKISIAYKTRSNDKIFLGSIYDPVAKHKNLYEAIRLEHFQARHLIPCFDEPNFKPKIRLRVKHPFEDQSSVIANMPVEREYEITLEQQSSPSFSAMHSQSDTSVGPADEETIEDETDGGSLVVRANGPPQEEKETGRVEKLKVVEFQPSVPMPISSLVFAIGPYQRIYDSHLDQSSNLVKVNFFAPNGHGLDECTIALEFAIKAVAWFQQHFESNEATAHPLKRINLVAVPSNDKWTISDGLGIGLIDHQFLLIDERLSSPGYEIEMALSVAQVVARQWFGHLMVPKSVEDSWITEGLAFHTAVRMVHSIKPEYKIHQYVKARYYRQAMFKKRTKSSIVNKLRGKSVLDLLQANVVRNDRVFNGIIGKLIKQTTRAGIVQSDMAAAFVIDGFSREQIDRIIDVQREFYLGDSLRVNLDSSGLIRISHQLETNVRWPVEMRLRFSNFDGTRTESIEVPVSEFEQGKHKIELKPPEWFTSENEEAWFVVELGKGQILPYHQLHYSSNIISRLRKPFETRLLKPAECVAILGQQANTIHMRTDGSYEMSNQIKMIGWFMEEKDPDVLLEVLDVIKWLSECRQYIRDPPYEFNKELKMIHNNLNGFTWIGNESLSEQRAKSAVALRLICFIRDREIISDAANYYLKNKDNIPAFYRGPVFLAVDKNDILDGAIKEELHARLLEASLAEDRSRGIFGCWSRVNEYY